MPDKGKRKDDLNKKYDGRPPCDWTKGVGGTESGKKEEKPLFIFCGQGGRAQFSSIDDPPVNIGSVAVDGRDLDKVKVKIKFSSIINLTSPDSLADPQAALTFRLFRVCNGGAAIPLNSWAYEVFNIDDQSNLLRFNTSFAFIFCDRTNDGRLCDYFVEVAVDNLFSTEISVDNVQIQAIAQ